MDSVHTTLLFITLSYVATCFQPYTQTMEFFSSAEDFVSQICCGVGAKSAVCVVRVIHTLKELNWPVVRHKPKHLVTTVQAQQNNSTATKCNVKVKVHLTPLLIEWVSVLRIICF